MRRLLAFLLSLVLPAANAQYVFYGTRTGQADGTVEILAMSKNVVPPLGEQVYVIVDGKFGYTAIPEKNEKGMVIFHVTGDVPLDNGGSNVSGAEGPAISMGVGKPNIRNDGRYPQPFFGSHGVLETGARKVGTVAFNSALTKGVATAIYHGVVMTPSDSARVREMQAGVNAQLERARKYNLEIEAKEKELVQKFQESAGAFSMNLEPVMRGADNYQFKTTNPDHLADLQENRNVLNAIQPLRPRAREIKELGLQVNSLADEAYASGEIEEGDGLLSVARNLADLAFGWDPITGMIRDSYEAFYGVGFITGEKLSDFSRSAAILGVLTMSLGSKIHMAGRILEKVEAVQRLGVGFQRATNLAKGIIHNSRRIKLSSEYRGALAAVEKFTKGQGLPNWLTEVAEREPGKLTHYVDLVNRTKDIKVAAKGKEGMPRIIVEQTMSRKALDAWHQVDKSRDVFRKGKFSKLESGGSRINKYGDNPTSWAFDYANIDAKDFAGRSGAFTDGTHFIEHGKIKPDHSFVIRESPPGKIKTPGGPSYNTRGGDLEVTVGDGAVETIELFDLEGIVR